MTCEATKASGRRCWYWPKYNLAWRQTMVRIVVCGVHKNSYLKEEGWRVVE